MKIKNLVAVVLATFAISAHATVVSFDGGSLNGSAPIAENTNPIGFGVGSSYVEDGMRVSFNDAQDTANSIGDYYGRNNNVLHWHYTGSSVRFALVSGGLFNLESFLLTSSTENGGGADTGNERVFVRANNGQSFQLPSNGWGNVETDQLVTFDSALFKGISSFTIDADSALYCLGVDDLTFNQNVPEPGSLSLLGLGLLGFAAMRRRNMA